VKSKCQCIVLLLLYVILTLPYASESMPANPHININTQMAAPSNSALFQVV